MNSFKVSDMNCVHCVSRITEQLKKLDASTEVDLESKLVSVDGDERQVTRAKELIGEIGYTVEA